MANPIQNTSYGTGEGRGDLEKIYRQPDREYLPMNVFVDPETTKAHFQCPSLHPQLTGILPAT